MSEIDMNVTDGVDDAVGEDLRLGLLIATQAAERLMQQVAEQRRQAETEAGRGAERAQAEWEAHRALARGATRGVEHDRWWQESSPAQVARAWTVATAWQGHDPELAERAGTLRQGLADRYGITNPDQLDVQDLVNAQRDHRAAQVAGPVNEAEWQAREYTRYAEELGTRRENLDQQAPDGVDYPAAQEAEHASVNDLQGQALDLAGQAQERADRLRGQGAAPTTGKEWDNAYDTVQRRTQLREQLSGAGVDAEATNARVLSDTAQAKPAQEAVRGTAGHAKARRRSRTPQRQAERGR